MSGELKLEPIKIYHLRFVVNIAIFLDYPKNVGTKAVKAMIIPSYLPKFYKFPNHPMF